MSLRSRATFALSRMLETADASEYFAGKKVVLIGPNCDPTEELAPLVQQADILVVINKGHRSKSFLELRPVAREVVLFHCLDRSEETGGGEFDSRELRRKGFRSVFYPLCEDRYLPNIEEYHRRNRALLRLRCIARAPFEALQASIQGFSPNTGYAAIWAIAKGPCAGLHISGINFMRSAYQAGYHSHLPALQSAIDLIEASGNHNPDLDLDSFRELIKVHPITYDKTLADILSRPTERLFYLKRKSESP